MPNYKTLVDALSNGHKQFPDKVALRYRENKEFKEITFAQAEEIAHALAVSLISEKIPFQGKVGLIADVSHYWSLANAGIQFASALDIPRGTDSTDDELAFILSHAGADTVFIHTPDLIDRIENGLKKRKSQHKIKKYFLLSGKPATKHAKKTVVFDEMIKKGKAIIEKNGKEYQEMQKRRQKLDSDHLATIIYTSGTTGEPKGVMLTQGNLASQCSLLPSLATITGVDHGMTLLPPWHIFGRTLEHLMFSVGVTLTYSDVKNFGEDMKTIRPTFIPAVPRIWESVYNKVMTNVRKSGKEKIFNFFGMFSIHYNRMSSALNGTERVYKKRAVIVDIVRKLSAGVGVLLLYPMVLLGRALVFKKILSATGGKLRLSISGGGALPSHIDELFNSIGIPILEGYGLTETSPVLAVRNPGREILGTVGQPAPATEIKVVDMEGNDVTDKPGTKGDLWVRGQQVMKGYYKNPKKTAEVLTKDGWFNTGDLVRITIDGHISIVGRSKDTIVLTGGENVEPEPIEDQIKISRYVNDCMLVGQDKKTLGVLIVPELDTLEEFVETQGIGGQLQNWVQDSKIIDLYKEEIKSLVNPHHGFKAFERVVGVRLLEKPFEKGVELSNKLSVKRHVVSEMYAELINSMYK